MGKTPQYLKQYDGITSGSYMGRDDGYAETKSIVYSDLTTLTKDFGNEKNEKYYLLSPIGIEDIEKETTILQQTQEQNQNVKRQALVVDKIDRLEKEKKKLDHNISQYTTKLNKEKFTIKE